MEKDIKILKDLKNKWELNAFGDMVKSLSLNEIKAIENILNRLEQLEKENERLNSKVTRYEKYLQNQKEKTEELLEYEYRERERDYIPKSEIRDKIEELEKQKRKDWDNFTAREYGKIEILKEILGDE